jgi:hypothetical protein
MMKYTNSRDINFRSIEYRGKTSTGDAARIDAITSKLISEKNASPILWFECQSIITLDAADPLHRNGKRDFYDNTDRVPHVIKIQKFIEYYNRKELSRFQVELNIS